MHIGILTTHPIQYQAPWFRALAKDVELDVFFAHRPTPHQQGSGFGEAFTWDVDLLSGYRHHFLKNHAKQPSGDGFSSYDVPEIGQHIRKEKFDAFIVTGWALKCYWQAVYACRKAKVPVLVRGDSHRRMGMSFQLKHCIKAIVYPHMLKLFDGFLTVGQWNAEYLRYYGVSGKKLFYAPHFVDNEWFAAEANKASEKVLKLRGEWQVQEKGLVVTFVGKLIPKKNPAILLAAISQLKFKENCRLIYIGSGELKESLAQQAKDLGITSIFTGFKNQSELPLFYAAVDVVVLPSTTNETWGLVVNEAMACGTPAIVSDVCGCKPDLINSGVTGFSFPSGDVSALTENLERVAALKQRGHDWKPALAAKLGAYSVETCTAGTLEAIRTVCTQRL